MDLVKKEKNLKAKGHFLEPRLGASCHDKYISQNNSFAKKLFTFFVYKK